MESPSATGPKLHTADQVREVREHINALLSKLNNEFDNSRELAIAKTKLQEARMWAGEELGRLSALEPVVAQPTHIVADQPDPAPSAPAEPVAPATDATPAPSAPEATAQHEVVVEPQAPAQ